MTSDRIREIQKSTGQENSISITQALMQVWNECAHEARAEIERLRVIKAEQSEDLKEANACIKRYNAGFIEARVEIKHKNQLIEQMREALRKIVICGEFDSEDAQEVVIAKAALSAAERSE